MALIKYIFEPRHLGSYPVEINALTSHSVPSIVA
jgi:hypothetical protein